MLEIGNRREFSLAREKEHYVAPPIQYSPCGRYLALSYALNGEVEVLNAQNFDLISTLSPQGMPASIFEWSPDGKFLAGAFYSRQDGKINLVIWENNATEPVMVLDDIYAERSGKLQSSFPKTFYWHSSLNEFALLANKGRVVRYAL